MAQAQSPHERDDHSLAKMKSTEDGHGTRREGRFRRAISRMVKSQTSSSPESEQGHPVHQPVHPHSRNPDQTSDGEETAVTEPPTGPFSASAENGYRPTSRASVPNPYTTRRLDVDDVDTGANPVGQWRGVGLDEPEPRSPHTPATTDTMTDNPTPESPTMPGSTERPEAPVPPAAQASPTPEPAADHRPAPGQHTAHEPHRPEAQLPEPQARSHELQPHESQPHWPAAEPAASGSPWEPPQAPYEPRRYAERPQAPYEPPHRDQARPQGPERGQDQRPAGHDPQAPRGYRGNPDPNGYRDHRGSEQAQGFEQAQDRSGRGYPADQRGPQQPGGQYPGSQYPGNQHPGDQFSGHQYSGSPYPENQQGRPGHPGHPGDPRGFQGQQGYGYQGQPPAPYPYPQAEYPPQPPVPPAPPVQHYPVHYAHPQPLPYQSAYPLPYQPPGYVLPGQPVIYPGQFGAYGQPTPYGQPVQHVIVLASGQQPQVVTAESVATLFAERSEPAVSQEVRQDKALTRSDPGGEAGPERFQEPAEAPKQADPAAVDAPAAGQPVQDTEKDGTAEEAEQAAAAVRAGVAEAVSEALLDAEPGSSDELLNEALAGLAMRDLSLVDALLETVEALETEAQDPDLLDKLFQIDNFATRMRRNGENFLVLTGHDGGESDAHDEIVPLLDVARAATSEIKDYPRVSLGKLPQTSITGLAADDISHLLAELLDNATANSPEHSQVVISARELEDGRLMIIVEDEGVGIPEDQLVELNGRLSGGPVLDDEVPKHMGLYVASRIAEKHGLETRLESRSFRGLSAYTIVPKGLLRVATPRQPGQTRTSMIPSASAPVTPTGPTPQQSANGKPVNAGTANGKPVNTGSANGSDADGSGSAGSADTKDAPSADAGGTSSVTAAGLPRRSATPHGSPLRMMPHPGALSENPPPPPEGREDTPPKLTGQARAEQIRDELGDFLDGERAALEGEELEGDKE